MRDYRKECLDELRTTFQALHESQFSEFVLRHTTLLPAVQKISNNIRLILQKNQQKFLQLTFDEKLEKYLYEKNYFGHIKKQYTVHADILSALENPNTRLEQHIQLHQIFIQNIYPQLIAETQKNLHDQHVKEIFHTSIFSERGRIKSENESRIETRIGINRYRVFNNRVQHTSEHKKAMFAFAPDTGSAFYQEMKTHHLPFVAGISGSSGSLRLGAELYGELTQEEKKQYAISAAAFFIASGNHSMHEVLSVFNKAWFDYSAGNYASVMPQTILDSDEYEKFSTKISNQRG